jgi:hypothetical protein
VEKAGRAKDVKLVDRHIAIVAEGLAIRQLQSIEEKAALLGAHRAAMIPLVPRLATEVAVSEVEVTAGGIPATHVTASVVLLAHKAASRTRNGRSGTERVRDLNEVGVAVLLIVIVAVVVPVLRVGLLVLTRPPVFDEVVRPWSHNLVERGVVQTRSTELREKSGNRARTTRDKIK